VGQPAIGFPELGTDVYKLTSLSLNALSASRILEKQNWLQMSQVFFCIRTLSLGGFAFQGFYERDRGT